MLSLLTLQNEKNNVNTLPKKILQKEFKCLAQAQTVSHGDKF